MSDSPTSRHFAKGFENRPPTCYPWYAMKRIAKNPRKPLRSNQIPATAAMLYEMEERLNHRMDAGFHKMDSKFSGVDSKFGSLESKFSGLESRFSGLESQFSGMKSEMHRIALLVEEQNARNRYVMDGYAQLYDLLERRLGGFDRP